MMKRLIALLMAALLALAAVSAVLAEDGTVTEDVPPDYGMEDAFSADQVSEPEGTGYQTVEELMGIDYSEWPKTMYVYTENGGTLNVRSEPRIADGNVIGKLEYGTKVTVESPVIMDPSWSVISYKGGVGYVAARYLVSSKPGPSKKQAQQQQDDRTKDLQELNKQMASARSLDKPLLIVVRASRTSGWINFRVGPGVAADRIASLPDGRQLKAIGETDKWYQAVDLETGKTGYLSKNYVQVLGNYKEPKSNEKQQLGKLNVNGAFTLQCALPDGYELQVVNMQGSKIVASILSESKEKPMLYLSIAYNELYSDVERMNDLSEESLAALEETFTEMNKVDISYRETAYGTKLLIAREVGNDTDFVDILTVYKGYEIEFVMTPNPEAKSQELTEKQIQMCVDFLSEVDFVPAK